MADQEKKGDEYVRLAEKKLKSWGFSSARYEDAAELFEKAVTSYKVGKAWDKAGETGKRLSELHLKQLDSKHEAASALVDASASFKKTNPAEAVECLQQAVELYTDIGRLSMAGRHCKEVAEIYEKEDNMEQAMAWFEKAADLYTSEGNASTTVSQLNLKVAEFSAIMNQYGRAVQIYEQVARDAVDSNLLKYSAKGYLLNAGICHLQNDDTVALQNALDKYQDWDPSFGGSREHKLLEALGQAKEEADVDAFTDAIKEYDSLSRLDAWKTTLLLRAKNALEAEPDLT
eukprot:jgi/Mesen1/2919/ME000175S02072